MKKSELLWPGQTTNCRSRAKRENQAVGVGEETMKIIPSNFEFCGFDQF